MANRCLLFLLIILLTHACPGDAIGRTTKALSFIENKGQIKDQSGNARNDIHYKLTATNGLNLFFADNVIHYQWAEGAPSIDAVPNSEEALNATTAPVDMYRMDVQLYGANPHPVITAESKTGYHERYYLSGCNDGAFANSYQKIIYHEIYPNIDWVFYVNDNGKLEHDFIIRPGGKVTDIKVMYSGAISLAVNADGSFEAATPMGRIIERAPYAYEQKSKRMVTSAFEFKNGVLGFRASPCQGTLIIDPLIDWGTYFGGTEYDDINDVLLGSDGFVYGVGSTSSLANIATTGAYQTTYGGGANAAGADALLTKFSQDGVCLWTTYYGGTETDLGRKITTDTSGNIYMAGYSASVSQVSTAGSYQPANAGGSYDAFLVKFDTAGARLWGTYYGGSNADGHTTLDVTTDKVGYVYLTGNTQSTDIATTPGAYQSALAGSHDAFLVKFNTTGQVFWSTYYGGAGADYPYAIAMDSAGSLYMTGRTQSSTGIATAGSQQPVIGGGQDGFLSRFSPSGQLLWGTYYGGGGLDRGYAVTMGDSGHIYIGGVTASTAGISTSGSFQDTYGGGSEDGFIASFDSLGFRQWATYYGGGSGESVLAMHYNTGNGALYCTGYSSSTAGISTGGSMQPVFAGGTYDVFISRFNSSGTLQWGSYYGGIDAEGGLGIDAGASGSIYLCGRTTSSTGIATPGGQQPAFNGGANDGFLTKIKDCTPAVTPDSISGPVAVCQGETHGYTVASVNNATSYIWLLPAGWSGTSITDSIHVIFDSNSGTIKVIALNDCHTSDTVSIPITVNPLPVTPQIVQNTHVLSTSQPYSSYQWIKDGQLIPGANGATYTVSQDGDYQVTVGNASGCFRSSTVLHVSVTAINELLTKYGISIYPNPAKDKLYIRLDKKATVYISGIEGRRLQTVKLTSGVNSLDLNGYASGLYVLRLFDAFGALLGAQKITIGKD